MSLKVGIVGLPNVGKSTLFNALTSSSNAESSNYPFCTIDPNVGVVDVPDERINKLKELVHPEKTIPTIIEFVDIAGLVEGASKGEGLGNKFLANIRECSIIVHVIRFFKDDDIHHVKGDINPKNDREIIESELILADLQVLEKVKMRVQKNVKGDKSLEKELILLEKLIEELETGTPAFKLGLSEEEILILKPYQLLSLKKVLYIANISEKMLNNIKVDDFKKQAGLEETDNLLPLAIEFEQQLSELSDDESMMLLEEYSLKDKGLKSLIKEAYKTLALETYFTAGVKEVRAWTIKEGTLAPQAAGVIHTDFERGFIKADVISYIDYVNAGSEQKAKEIGKLRQEGKDYLVKDGDIIHFKFNV